MTDHSNDPKFAFYQTPERKARKWISVSKCDTVLNCPWAYHAHYELNLPKPPPSKAIVMGRVFDALCDNGDGYVGSLDDLRARVSPEAREGLQDEEVGRVVLRHANYTPHMPKEFTTQVPIELDLDYKGYWLMGFLDILPDDPDKPIIEVKFSQRPWSDTKYKRKKFQGVCYSEAWSRMAKLDYNRPVRFDVSNYEDDQLQQWVVGTKKISWTYARKRFIKAIDLIEGEPCESCNGTGNARILEMVSGKQVGDVCVYCCAQGKFTDRDPTPDYLCKGERLDDDGNVMYDWICDYWDVCPEQIKNRRVKEIAELL